MEKAWLYAAVGGFVPSIVWLIFWLNEDKGEPEPRRVILKTFLFGSISAFFAIFIEILINRLSLELDYKTLLFALTEETVKFFAFFFAVFFSRWNNEKSDPILYMIVAALGFAAVENMYYIIDYLTNKDYIQTILDGSYRFIGASLLHVVSSGIIGLFIAFAYKKRTSFLVFSIFIGLSVSTFVHYIFNVLVMDKNSVLQDIAFISAWILTIFFLIVFDFIGTKKNKD